MFTIIDTDADLKSQFRRLLAGKEVYKFLSDVLDSSQNILLIAEGQIRELPEIMDTYTDTWGKLVKFLEIRKFVSGNDTIYTITPDFDTIQYIEPSSSIDQSDEESQTYDEEFHLEGVSDNCKTVFNRIKELVLLKNSDLVFNPQKYYISIRADKNIAFLKIRKKKVRFIAMMPEENIRKIVDYYAVASLSQGVQDFYNGPCAAIDFVDLSHDDELKSLINKLIEYHSGS